MNKIIGEYVSSRTSSLWTEAGSKFPTKPRIASYLLVYPNFQPNVVITSLMKTEMQLKALGKANKWS